MGVWLVHTMYQYDGYDGTEVLKNKPLAVKMANKIAQEHLDSGYEFCDWLSKEEQTLLTEEGFGLFGGLYLDSKDGEMKIFVEYARIKEEVE